MKTREVSHWLLIRWGFVALIYAGTVAIAVDQLKSSRVEKERQGKEITALTVELQASQRKALKSQAAAEEWEQKGLQLADQFKKYIAAQKTVDESNARIQELKSQMVQTRTIEQPIALRAPVADYHPTVASPVVNPPPPAWVPPQMHMQAKLIKGRAEAKWKNNYSMVNHEIESETQALERLRDLNRYTANKPFLAWAAEKWPDDFSMMVHEFDRQTTAKAEIDSRR